MSITQGLATRPDPNMRAGDAPSARRQSETERLIRGARGIGSTRVRLRPWGIEIGGGAAGLDLSLFQFGIVLAGPTVTLNDGEVQWGMETAVTPVTTLTITQDYQYIGVESDGTTATVLGPSTSVSVFRSDSAKFRTWLFRFRLQGGAAKVHRIGHLGNIIIPAVTDR